MSKKSHGSSLREATKQTGRGLLQQALQGCVLVADRVKDRWNWLIAGDQPHRASRALRRRTARRLSFFETLEARQLFATDLGLGDVVFTGYQSTNPDKISLVLLREVEAGSVLTVTDNAWNGTELRTTEGNSVITFGATFQAGTQLNFDFDRPAGSRWTVGASSDGLSESTVSNFAINASGDNLFAYNGTTPPSSGTSSAWVSAFASNAFVAAGGSVSASTTQLPSVFTVGVNAFTLGLTGSNQNGALVSPASVSGSPAAIRTTVYDAANWQTFTTAGGRAIPPNISFSVVSGPNTPPTLENNNRIIVPNASTTAIQSSTLQAIDSEQNAASLTFTLTTLPANGQILKSGVPLTTGGSFTQDDINQQRVSYRHSGGNNLADSFVFNLSDGAGGVVNNQTFSITVTPKVLLSEIKVNPPGSDPAGNRFQFIELRGAPGVSLDNVYIAAFEGNGNDIGTAEYVIDLSGAVVGANGYVMIKSPTSGHAAAPGSSVVTDAKFDTVATGVLSKRTTSFFLAYAEAPLVEGTDYDQNDDGELDNLPAGFTTIDNVGWRDEDVGDWVYGGVALTQSQGTPDAATRFPGNDTASSTAAWFNGDLYDIGNDPWQTIYDVTRVSSNFPFGAVTPRMTPGAQNFNQAPVIAVNEELTLNTDTTDVAITETLLLATDVEQSAAELSFTILALPTAGTLKFNGNQVVAGATNFTQVDIASGALTFDAPSTVGNYSFSFTVGDGFTTTSGSFTIIVDQAPVNSLLRIANYNLAASGGDGIPRAGITTLLEAFGNEAVNSIARAVDLFIFQEVRSQATTTQYIVDQLNGVYGANTYARGSLNGATTGAGTLGVVYNTTTLSLLSEVAVGTIPTMTRQAIRYLFNPIGAIGNSSFYVYAAHLKASDTSSDAQKRQQEAQIIRANADALGEGANVIYAGDFNVYTSNEAAFQTFVGAGFGQAFDPINRLGNWSNNSSFRDTFTQAPSTTPPSGLVGGGLDDRFDFQLLSGEFFDNEGLEYLPGSYRVFGNNGSVAMNSSVNSPSSTALVGLDNRTELLNLLATVSDHLPVIVDYSFTSSGNNAPVIPPQTFSIAENSANGTLVGTVNASDPDAGDTLQFSIVGGNEVGAFSISSQGNITVSDSSKLDFESTPQFQLLVRATDPGFLFDTETITINLTNVIEPPVILPQEFTISENLPAGTLVGNVIATPDATRSLTGFSIISGNGTGIGAFAINGQGVLVVADAAQIDFEAVPDNRFTLSVSVSDSQGGSGNAIVTVVLTDLFEGSVLSPGDLVITGINSDDNDEFTFVPLVDLAPDTQIRFTDNGWLSAGGFRTGEGVIRYAAPKSGIQAGTRIGIVKDGATNALSFSAPGTNQGTIVHETGANAFALSTSGDQLFAFQGGLDSPSLLYGITTNRNSFDLNAIDANTSALPPQLTFGVTALALGNLSSDIDNGDYNNSINSGEPTAILAAVSNVNNWTRNNSRLNLSYADFDLEVKSPPEFDQPNYTFFVPENSPAGTVVGVVSASDPDPNTVLTYGLSGVDANQFVINAVSGEISVAVGAILDFETKPTYLLTATVSDGDHVVTAPLIIQLVDVPNESNQPPTVADQTFNIHSKTLASALVGTVLATPSHANQSLRFTIVSGNATGAFQLNAITGELRVANSKSLPRIPRGQTSVNSPLLVRVFDADAPSVATEAIITVSAISAPVVRMAPTVNAATFTLAENNKKTDGTTKVGTIKPLAAYSGQKFTILPTLSGPDAASFRINSKGGITLAPGVSLDFETQSTYSFNVSVADSLDATKITTAAVTVNVRDINEAPVYTLSRRDPVTGTFSNVPITKTSALIALDENIPTNVIKNGLVVAVLTAADVDDGTVLALQTNAKGQSILLDKTGAFEYDLATGEIRIKDETKVDFEKFKTIKLNFIVTDTPIAGDPKSKPISTKLTVTIALNDLNEAPVIAAEPSSFSIAENNKAGAKVGSVKVKDADTKAAVKQTLSYSIVSQFDSASQATSIFGIDSKGTITVPTAGVLDYETSPYYDIVVRVTDSGAPTLFTDKTIRINVRDVNEAATFGLQNSLNESDASLSISKSAINNNDKVGRLLISDVDAGMAGSYSPSAIRTAVEKASKGALTYDELTGDLLVKDKNKLARSFELKLSLKDQSLKPVTSKFNFQINVI